AVASAGTLQPVQLPRDHGAHAGFSVEWWYATGHASGAHGRRYFWFATIWTAPQGAVGRVNVVDLARDKVVLAKEWARAAPIAGRPRRLNGLAWFDHQWGDFAAVPGALRWDWFACQLEDGRDLMVAQFLNAQDQPLPGVGQGTLVDARGHAAPVQSFTATPVG